MRPTCDRRAGLIVPNTVAGILLAAIIGLSGQGAAAQDLWPIEAPCRTAPELMEELDAEGGWPVDIYVDGSVAYLDGDITDALPCKIRHLAETHTNVRTLILDYMPGSMDDNANLKAGYMLRRFGFNTHVTPDSALFSGAVDLFLAGVERTGEPGAVFGVHAWGTLDEQGQDVPRDDPVHQEYLAYFDAMGIDRAFYWFTLEAAPYDGMHLMTPSEIRRFGIFTPD